MCSVGNDNNDTTNNNNISIQYIYTTKHGVIKETYREKTILSSPNSLTNNELTRLIDSHREYDYKQYSVINVLKYDYVNDNNVNVASPYDIYLTEMSTKSDERNNMIIFSPSNDNGCDELNEIFIIYSEYICINSKNNHNRTCRVNKHILNKKNISIHNKNTSRNSRRIYYTKKA
jgi:hypothetical protein